MRFAQLAEHRRMYILSQVHPHEVEAEALEASEASEALEALEAEVEGELQQ